MSLRVELPDLIDLVEVHRRDPKTFPFLLESAAGHRDAGRFDILFGFPGTELQGQDGFDQFAIAVSGASAPQETDLPFVGGWFLLMGYECVRWIEPSLRLPPSPFRLPDFLAIRCTAAIVNDRQRGVAILVSEGESDQINYMKNVVHNIDRDHDTLDDKIVDHVDEDSDGSFLDGVERIRRYLLDGDVFQVNLSRAWRGELRPGRTYYDAYRRLKRRNPSPFAGLAVRGDVAVLSSSPERLVQSQGGWVQTRPIAGTRARAPGDDDAAMRAQLIGNLKERAEHVMLIDLERNDLGRVCEPGSVEVNELMALESYAHVHHIVSNVRGRLRAGVGPGDILRAVFPGGTITGCPKVRAMQIIAELEGVGRGPYTGAMGYWSYGGRLDTNILIRSLVIQDAQVSFRAGAGIVADSQPLAELAETRAKARGLLLALGEDA